jgi:ABC-2 type transport system ATP-binding protein
MIDVERLRSAYGSLLAVDDLSFTARPGEIFGLLGPNGAGKTTCISCICGLLKPTAGRVSVMGHDTAHDGRRARESLGVVPQEIALYDDLSAPENLAYWGGAHRMHGRALRDRVQEVLSWVGLADRAREPVARFSGGMKRRLNFACGIVHRPKVLLLDEPTVGVDPQSRVRLLELTRELARDGATVLYTTHYMEEAESLCDRVVIIDHGRILAQGTLPELRSLLGERDLLRFSGVFQPDFVHRIFSGDGIDIVQADENAVTLALHDASGRLPSIFAVLAGARAEIRGTRLSQPSLESLFIKLTGKELRE